MFCFTYQEVLKMNPFEARRKIIETYEETGSIRKTAKTLGISRNTMRKWMRRHSQKGLTGLFPLSRRPKKFLVKSIRTFGGEKQKMMPPNRTLRSRTLASVLMYSDNPRT